MPNLPEALGVAVVVHVAVLGVAAAGGDEEDRAVVLPAALEAVEQRTALGVALLKHPARIVDVDVLGIGLVDVDPGHRQAPARLLALAHVELRPILHGEHLQAPALGQLVRMAGQVAVEAGAAARRGILGLVHDSVVLVDGDRLVGEAAGVANRLTLLQLVRTARQGDLEEIAVTLRKALGGIRGTRAADRLLGRDPAAQPVAAPAGAVHDRAVEADVVGHELPAVLVVDQGCGSAPALGVVLGGRIAAHAPLAGQVAVLAVAHEPDLAAAAPRERAHAVQGERRGVAVGHRGAGVAEGHVGEARGQRQHLHAALVGHPRERAIGITAAWMALRGRCVCRAEALERGRAEQATSGHRGPSGDERTTVERVRHAVPPLEIALMVLSILARAYTTNPGRAGPT